MLPEVPTTSARVLVALATIGGVPKKSRVGKVTNVPPPAMALIAPPATAESNRPTISISDIPQANEPWPQLKFEGPQHQRRIPEGTTTDGRRPARRNQRRSKKQDHKWTR